MEEMTDTIPTTNPSHAFVSAKKRKCIYITVLELLYTTRLKTMNVFTVAKRSRLNDC